jgi:hypothetical protein
MRGGQEADAPSFCFRFAERQRQKRMQDAGVGCDQYAPTARKASPQIPEGSSHPRLECGERLTPARRDETSAGVGPARRLGEALGDLRPNEPFPFAHHHLAPASVDLDRPTASDRPGRQAGAFEVAAHDQIVRLAAEAPPERFSLGDSDGVEGHVGVALKARFRVPGGLPVADRNQLEFAQLLGSIGWPSRATSRSCMSLACSSSTAKIASIIVRVDGSLSAKNRTSSR